MFSFFSGPDPQDLRWVVWNVMFWRRLWCTWLNLSPSYLQVVWSRCVCVCVRACLGWRKRESCIIFISLQEFDLSSVALSDIQFTAPFELTIHQNFALCHVSFFFSVRACPPIIFPTVILLVNPPTHCFNFVHQSFNLSNLYIYHPLTTSANTV